MRYTFEERGTGGRLLLAIDEPLPERTPYRSTESPLLTIAWNRGPAQTVWVDGVPLRVPARGLLTLMASHAYRFERSSQLVLWEFNGDFYCIVDHDREVSCAGLLFYGGQGALVLEPSREDARRLAALLDVFVDEFGIRDDIQGEMLRMLLKRLVIRLTRLAREASARAGVAEAHLDLIRQFNRLVEQHYRRLHRVRDYARLMHRSPKTLANVFARADGRSPSQLIRERIAVEAKRLLRYTDRSAKQIAHDLGFDDPAAFSRFFRTETGVSPTAFRPPKTVADGRAGGRADGQSRQASRKSRHGVRVVERASSAS